MAVSVKPLSYCCIFQQFIFETQTYMEFVIICPSSFLHLAISFRKIISNHRAILRILAENSQVIRNLNLYIKPCYQPFKSIFFT